ncbi:MAG: transketolase, partial [Gemmatimonadetes bacterium]|nr:transketolase [Gemmatimonadota bacterium]
QENPRAKWEAFGWAVTGIDGHDFRDILRACAWASENRGRPSLIVARTVKGKGISYMENDFNWHSKPVTDEDLRVAREELAAQEAAL